MEKTEYYQIHTQNLITTKYKIDVSLFEEQIQIFPFQKWEICIQNLRGL